MRIAGTESNGRAACKGSRGWDQGLPVAAFLLKTKSAKGNDEEAKPVCYGT